MIKIFPDLDCELRCPLDSTRLENRGFSIPGMRCLADAVCPTCGAAYYADLPVGQALWSPAIINRATAKVYDATQTEWFSQPLQTSWQKPVTAEIVPTVHRFFEADRIIIINCLDFLYGHSLLKLLNVQRHIDQSPDWGCCVLVPTQLMHLVPEGVAEIWEFPAPIKEGWQWYVSLERWISQQVTQRQECFLSRGYSHPSPKSYDIQRFVQDLPDISSELEGHSPIILFSYREDRLWGRSLGQQQRRLQKLYNRLSQVFPEMAFVLVGFGQQNQFFESGAKLIDLRVTQFSVSQDRLWMAHMSITDCAIGVHGSNMLLPSGLAKTTLELVPRSRLPNTVQDLLFPVGYEDCRDALLNYRLHYGNESLSDVQPSSLVDHVANLLAYAPINATWFKIDRTSGTIQPYLEVHESPVSWAARQHMKNRLGGKLQARIKESIAELLFMLD
ncbi:hypothetical protein [Pseudanabaena sp. FACHB-2040]|uniref:hypothetical protein n=1 Tax=Pseudanabaena sp. FACHB-2040 TaxID=2692859 RepID=UPI0016851A89|nr:hypothetical protein [Pseudanabaena sp. FACHB-2040]MBD2260784.1 hypothetical protein [Pseudanabaena sp. FACHB-2040]